MKTACNKLLNGSRILLVEDEAFATLHIINALGDAGAEIIGPAMSLERALELATTEDLDCAVLDVMLRDGLVFPAASILKQRGAGLIYYTAYFDLDALRQDWAGFQVLLKPASPNLLVQAVKAVCSR